METPLVATGSKWIATNGKPLYPGDLIHNWGCYNVHPDYTDRFWKLQHMHAEKFTYDRARAKSMYDTQAMYYAAASSGWMAWRMGERFTPKVLQHSRSLSTQIQPDGTRKANKADEMYYTICRMGEAVESEVMASDIFAVNYRNQMSSTLIAANNLKNPATGERDGYVIGPVHRENHMRNFAKIHALSRGTSFEDVTWEVHLWGPMLLHKDTTHGIYDQDHAWSRNAALEKAIGLAIQYGSPIPLLVREGETFHVVDRFGRPVSIVDQAWEDARHLVYEITRPHVFDGKTYGARSETAAALMLSRFMHDEMFRNGAGVAEGGLDKARAHESVKAHYASPAETAKFDKLREIMLPFLAKYCNWPTLHEILKRDPALQKYWDTHVAPAAARIKPEIEIKNEVLSYLPRGGFETPELMKFVEKRADPVSPQRDFNLPDLPDIPDGLHEDGFAHDFDPKIFNDRNFARLGRNGKPSDDPDPDHLSFEQAACMSVLSAYRHDGIPPLDRPNRALYLDNVKSGYAASAYIEKHAIDDASELNTKFDALAKGGSTFGEVVAKETAADLRDRVREVGKSGTYDAWRKAHKIGLVDCVSDIAASLNYTGRREATDTELHESIAASGSMHLSGEALETVTRRLIDLEENNIILLPGTMDGLDAKLMVEAVLAATGQTPRTFSGGKYRMQFFMDFDYWKPPQYRGAPVKLDLADLIIHLGIQVKAKLEQANPEDSRDLYVSMARLLDIYERVMDPARRNKVTSRDPHSGKDKKKDVIDLKQIDPAFISFMSYDQRLPDYLDDGDMTLRSKNPEYDAFFADSEYKAFAAPEAAKPGSFYAGMTADPIKKAKLAKLIWGWMRAESIQTAPGKVWPVPGHLNFRGIRSFDKSDLKDLHGDYERGFRAWHNLNARDRATIFNQQRLLVETPSVRR
jgi:hypothetical protein